MKKSPKQRMRHARRPPYAMPPSTRVKDKTQRPTLNTNECRALMTDRKVLSCLNEFEQRFYRLYMNGMPLSGLAKLTLDDVPLAQKTLRAIERKMWKMAPKLNNPRPGTVKDSVEEDYNDSAVDADIYFAGGFEDESGS